MMIEELSIIIPCFNEQDRILKTLHTIETYCKKNIKKYEIIIVDDGSTDKTFKLISMNFPDIIILRNITNYGKGFSVKKGMGFAKYNWALFSDADLSAPIEEVEKLFKEAYDYEVVFGSRNAPNGERVVNQNIIRVIAGRTFPIIVNLIMGWNYGDTQCGFKLFSKKAREIIFEKQTINGFAFDVELLYIAKINNIKCKEVGVKWVNSPNSKVDLIRDSWKMFNEVLKIKKTHR